MFERFLDRILSNTEELSTVERYYVVAGILFVISHWFLDLFFLVVSVVNDLPAMVLVNITSMIVSILNIYVILGHKTRNLGYSLMIWNTCFYVLASTYLLGYDKNSNVLIPLMILVTYSFLKNNNKYLFLNLIVILSTCGMNVFMKNNVIAMYGESTHYADFVNNAFAILGTLTFLYFSEKTEVLVTKYTNEKLKKLSNEASLDHLTGLKNRRFMESYFTNDIDNSEAYIVMCDVDFFKKVNDNYGHLCGDMVLKEVAKILVASFRKSDVVCRWGGEEFLIYVKKENKIRIEDRLNEIREKIEETEFEYNDIKFNITITFGVCKINTELDMNQNIENADIALYYGKEISRNVVVNFKDIKHMITL